MDFYIMFIHYITTTYTYVEKLPCKLDSMCVLSALDIVQHDIILRTTHKISWHAPHKGKMVKSQYINIFRFI